MKNNVLPLRFVTISRVHIRFFTPHKHAHFIHDLNSLYHSLSLYSSFHVCLSWSHSPIAERMDVSLHIFDLWKWNLWLPIHWTYRIKHAQHACWWLDSVDCMQMVLHVNPFNVNKYKWEWFKTNIVDNVNGVKSGMQSF